MKQKKAQVYKRFERPVSDMRSKSQLGVGNKVGKVSNVKSGRGWNRQKQEDLGSDSDQGVDSPDSDVRDRSTNEKRFENSHLVDKRANINART